MRVLLLSPPYLPEYMRNARCDFVSLSATQWYPILLGYCGAYLESQGHEVSLIDAPAHGLDHETTRKQIQEFKPELLVLYTGRQSEDNDIQFAEPLVEKLACAAVIVGPYASIDPEETLSKCRVIDKLIVGEFEHAVGELAAGAAPAAVGNLVFKEEGVLKKNPARPYLTTAELDAIPFVSKFFRDHIDVYRYKTPSEFYPYLDILTGRGCRWGQCTYCLWVHTFVRGMTYNLRSVDNVIEEFCFIAREMPHIRCVMLQDDTLTEPRAHDLAEAKIKSGLRLPWSCYTRGNMSLEVLRLMKRAGCRNLHVGYESADPAVLKRIKKGVSVERMTQFTADAKRAGLRIHGDFAFGFPGETLEGAQKTIDWACKMNPHTAQFQLMIPFPGTPFYEEMKQNGWLTESGEPNMPQLSNTQIRAMAKKAYRAFYLSPRHAWKCIRHPYEHFFSRIKTMRRAIPAMFWKKWKV
jgi:anaerobic magnesium-protoporphyrin IX monomethyl ester cyclase